jgi:hypothetical protein
MIADASLLVFYVIVHNSNNVQFAMGNLHLDEFGRLTFEAFKVPHTIQRINSITFYTWHDMYRKLHGKNSLCQQVSIQHYRT